MSHKLPVPVSDLRSAATVLLTLPGAWLFQHIHGLQKRTVCDLGLGILLSILSSGTWFFVSILNILVTYSVLCAPIFSKLNSGNNKITNCRLFQKISPRCFVAFTANFIILFIVQILKHIQLCTRTEMTSFYNWTGAEMILFQKLIAIVVRMNQSPERTVPTLFELFAYAFDINGSLAGSYIDFDDFMEWLEEKNVPNPEQRKSAQRKPLIGSLITGLLCLVVFGVFSGKAKKVFNDELDPTKPWMIALAIRLALLTVAGLVYRCKYYFIWSIFRASTILSGFAFDKSGLPTRGKNIDILKVEFAGSPREAMAAWNMNTTRWLREFIYVFCIEMGMDRKKSTFITNISSAIWHGIAPGYFMYFAGFSGLVLVERIEWSRIRPGIADPLRAYMKMEDPKNENKIKMWKAINWIYMTFKKIECMLNTTTLAPVFFLLHFKPIWHYLVSVWFYPAVVIVIRYVVYTVLASLPWFKKWAKERRAGAALSKTPSPEAGSSVVKAE